MWKIGVDNNKSKNEDVKFIYLLYKIGNFLVLTPIKHKKKSASVIFKYCYTAAFMSTLAVCLIYAFYRKATKYESLVLHRIIISGALSVSEFFFVMRTMLGSLKLYPENWKSFFKSLNRIEKNISSDQFLTKPNKKVLWIRVIFYHLMFIFLVIYEVYTTTTTLNFAVRRVIHYLQFFELILISNICRILKRRYVALSRIVLDIFNPQSRKSDERRKADLKKVFSLYQILYSLSAEFQTIFGWQIFFILICTVFTLLNHANRILFILRETKNFINNQDKYVANGFLHPFTWIVATVVLVMACDSVEKSAANVIVTCHRQLMHLERSTLRHELQLITKYMDKLKPSFTAAGFFEINQMILASIFTSVTTYLIIMIQFQ